MRQSLTLAAGLTIAVLAATAAAQELVLKRLEASPRHQEWVAIKNGERTVHAFVVYPERKDKTAVVVVIHENRGLTDWVRGVADQVAEAGYIAVAPDLLSGTAPGGGKTSDFPSSDAAREAISKLTPDGVTSDLDALAAWATKLPAANGKLAVGGFCWGGGQTFRYATHNRDLAAAFPFYGAFQHTKEDLAKIACPVHGFYGGDDARINATIPATDSTMKRLSKSYEFHIFDGAGHGFLRGQEQSPANLAAAQQAWPKTVAFFRAKLGG